jgi:hypothetical protein
MPEASSKPIFVSHAVADRALADQVVDLLSLGMGIDAQQQVFCSSLEGLGIPAGQDFKQFIKDQIQEPKLVFLLISQNYLASPFCLAEVGASWAMSHAVVPLLVPPLKFTDLKAVLTGTQAGLIDNPSYWNEVLEVSKKVLRINPPTNRWERKRDEKIAEIKRLIPKQPAVPLVPVAKLAEVERRLREANAEIEVGDDEIARLKRLLAEIKQAKDAKEVAAIEFAALPEAEAFAALLKKTKKAVDALPDIVGRALFYHVRRENMKWPKYANDDRTDEIKSAIEGNFLENLEEHGVCANEGDPKVARAVEVLRELEDFIEKHSDFAAAYADKFDHQLVLASEQFWKRHLK